MTTAGLEIRCLSDLRGVDPSEWDGIVAPTEVCARHAYLCALADGEVEGCEFRFLEARWAGELVAHAHFYTLTFDANVDRDPWLGALLGPPRLLWRKFMHLRMLQVGNPTNIGRPVAVSQAASEEVQREALVGIVEEVWRQAQRADVGLITWRDFYGDEPLGEVLSARGYRTASYLPNVLLPIRWSSFDDYLAELRSHYRYKVRRRMRRLERAGASVEVVEDFLSLAPEMAQLWANTHERAKEYRWERVGAPFFASMSRHLAGRARVLAVRHEGRLAGFALVVDGGTTSKFQYTGLDYRWNEELAIYHNLLLAVVRHGIERGFQTIDLGISTYPAKLALGGELRPITLRASHLQPVLRALLPAFMPMLGKPAPHVVPVRPFRNGIQSRL